MDAPTFKEESSSPYPNEEVIPETVKVKQAEPRFLDSGPFQPSAPSNPPRPTTANGVSLVNFFQPTFRISAFIDHPFSLNQDHPANNTVNLWSHAAPYGLWKFYIRASFHDEYLVVALHMEMAGDLKKENCVLAARLSIGPVELPEVTGLLQPGQGFLELTQRPIPLSALPQQSPLELWVSTWIVPPPIPKEQPPQPPPRISSSSSRQNRNVRSSPYPSQRPLKEEKVGKEEKVKDEKTENHIWSSEVTVPETPLDPSIQDVKVPVESVKLQVAEETGGEKSAGGPIKRGRSKKVATKQEQPLRRSSRR